MRPSAVRAEINVTPLVDVVLVLLIIFMVVGPMIARGFPVELPRTVHHQKQPEESQDLLVTVDRQGRVYLGSEAIEVAAVGSLVEAEHRRRPGRRIYVQGDSASRYGDVRQVMQAVGKASGAEQVLLRTSERRPATAGATRP